MKKKILFVSHCILNTSSKVVMFNEDEINAEEKLRKEFLGKAISNDIQLVQLPCPEFTLYGAKRWGHVSNQFDNPFFRAHVRKILVPVIDQLEEYLSNDDSFEVLGFLGIDGSPSCGVDYTCYGDWYGSFEAREDLDKVISSCSFGKGEGILISVLKEMLKERGFDKVKITALYANEPDKCLNMIK